MDLQTIVITWMDGPTAAYEDAHASVINGVLNIYAYVGPSHVLRNEWHFPISNIRAWGPRAWAPIVETAEMLSSATVP